MKAQTPRIWLTGSRGFIGRALVRTLTSNHVDLTCFTQNIDEVNGPQSELGPVHLDYMDPADIKEKIDRLGLPDIFIHLGWGDMANPESLFHLQDNVQTAKNLIETFYKLGLKKFIFIGSMNQYGGRTGPLAEDMLPLGRLTNYAKGKNEVERIGFEAAEKFGKVFISVRTFYVFGAGQRQGSLINDLLQAHLKGTDVSLSPCEHYRDYIHVSDVAEGVRRICAIGESTIVNLGSGKVVQVKDFVTALWERLGGDPVKLKFGMRKFGPNEPDQPQSYADLTRLIRLTQWRPALSLPEGIAKTVEEGLSDE